MITNIAGYRFITLIDLPNLKSELLAQCQLLALKGTILLAPEGINVFLAGEQAAIQAFIDYLNLDSRFMDIRFKYSESESQPFRRLRVKLKKEIITMGQADIMPALHPAPGVTPLQFKQWLDQGEEVVVIDTRNDYEYEVGTFDNALNLRLRHFRHFTQAVDQLDPAIKSKRVVIFCTGGIRCEKAAPYMLNHGFKEVYQLEGGILNYFEQCGGAYYHGACFVFDDRITLDPELKPKGESL